MDPIASTDLTRFLFPAPPRDFPGKRWVKIVCRAIHVLFVCGLVGATLFARDEQHLWYAGTGYSGLAILLVDLHGSAVFVLQVRGLIVLLKITVFVALPTLGAAASWALGALVLISVISSHAPARFRYFMLVGRGRFTPSLDKG